MNKIYFFGKFIGFSLLLFGSHYYINLLFDQEITFNQLKKIHFFLALITFVILNTLLIIKSKMPDYVGFGYLAFVLIKMAISLVFIYPTISSKPDSLKVYIFHFFSIFFLYLLTEVLILIKELKA